MNWRHTPHQLPFAPGLAAGMLSLTLGLIGCGGGGITGSEPARPVTWVAAAWTQPVPAWGSPVRLELPVALSDIVLGPMGGLGAFGAHQGGHIEGLDHVWIPTRPGTVIRSWADGKVTKIDDMGPRGTPGGQHEFFITIDYGRGLIGKHLDVDAPLVTVGQTVKAGDPIARAPSAEFWLVDNYRTDGERTGGSTGSPVSPFDYLKDDIKTALVARHVSEVVTPYFSQGQSAGNARPWEPLFTNQMLFHADHRGTFVGEWILTNKGWSQPDPVYFEVMVFFDVTNAYGHFQRAEMMDHDWSIAGNKQFSTATWQATDGAGKVVLTLQSGAIWYGLYSVDESGGRAHLTLQLQQGSYPTAISAGAATYVERAPIYLTGDAQALGLLH